MEQKAKFIIVGLAIFTLACLFLFMQAFSAKQNLTRERDDLKVENSTLNAKVDKLAVSLRSYETRITSLTKDLEETSRQKEDLNKKYDEVSKANDVLIQKLKERVSQPEPSAQNNIQEATPVVNDAYWADILKKKGELELQLSGLRDDFRALQVTNEQAQREKNTLELDLNNLKRENADLKRQVDYNQKLSDSIAQELVREKNDKSQIQDNYKTVKNENALLSRQLQALSTRKVNLEKKIQELQVNKDALESRLSGMESALTEKMVQLGGLQQQADNIKSGVAGAVREDKAQKRDSVDLPAIVVRPKIDAAGKYGKIEAASPGKVLAINRDNNFVIISLGQDFGLQTGDLLKVYKGQKVIATLEVIQSRQDISACDIKREAETINIGDAVNK